jgi:hypothetical protein
MPCGQRQTTTSYNGQATSNQGGRSRNAERRHAQAGELAQQGYSVQLERPMEQYTRAAQYGQTENVRGANYPMEQYTQAVRYGQTERRHAQANELAQQGYSVQFERPMEQYTQAARYGQTEPIYGASQSSRNYDAINANPDQGYNGLANQGGSTTRARSPERQTTRTRSPERRSNLRFGEMSPNDIITHGHAAQLQEQYFNEWQPTSSSTQFDGQEPRHLNLTDQERERRRQRALSMPRDPTTGRFMSPRRH